MNLEEQLSNYRTEILFLLVGENPLPNNVAARLLLKKGGHLYLIHSEGSGRIAMRLAKYLQIPNTCTIEVDEFDSEALGNKIQKYLENLPPGRLGLNYTGATKFIAVHTYRTIDEFCRDREIVLSYLHADTLELTIEPRPGVPGLRRQVVDAVPSSLTFKDIFSLHGIEVKEEPQSEPHGPELAQALAEMQSTKASVQAWKEGRTILLDSDGQVWRKIRKDLLNVGVAQPVVDQLEKEILLADDEQIDLDALAERLGTSKGLRGWLEGHWLEDWTLTCLERLGIAPRVKNLEGLTQENYKFEIDVAFMRGYQLFAISCKAVSSRKIAKLGLMEIFARARQMGGEEARAALVTTYHDADDLKKMFAGDWGADKRIRVFGCTHLANLENELKTWFENP